LTSNRFEKKQKNKSVLIVLKSATLKKQIRQKEPIKLKNLKEK